MRTTRPLLLATLLLVAIATPVRSHAPPAPPDAVFYDATEGLKALAALHYTADLIALIAGKGLGALGIDTGINIYPREDARRFATQERALPGLGCYTRAARTQAKSQQERHNSMEAHYELLVRYPDAVTARTHAELAAESLLLLIDRFREAGLGVEGGGEEAQSVLVDIDGAGPADGLEFYEEWVHVVAPIWDTDVVT